MPIITDEINLPVYPEEVIYAFTERVNFFTIENHSFYNIECFFDDETDPHTLEKKVFRKFEFPCSKIRFKSYADTISRVEVLSVFGDGFFAFADKDTETPFLLRIFKEGDILKEIAFHVIEAFDSNFTVSVGTILDEESVIIKNFVKTKILALSSIELMYRFDEFTEMMLFYHGTSLTGKMIIYTN